MYKRVKTQEEFVEEAKRLNGDNYDYSLTVFEGLSKKVKIPCNNGHPTFWQLASAHLRGHGCALCGVEKNKQKQLAGKDAYVSEVSDVHKSYYTYANTEYLGAQRKLTVTCPVHGDFSISADAHKRGQGCGKCGHGRGGDKNRIGLEKSIADSNAIHNFKYDYSLIKEYTRCKDPVDIICPEHGVFSQPFNQHKRGGECPSCATNGYSKRKAGSLYIFVSETLLKVGITNRAVPRRLANINRESPEKFVIHSSFNFKDGNIPSKLESACLGYLRSKYKQPDKPFHGSTECFIGVDVDDLLNFVIPIVNSAQQDAQAVQIN